MPTRALRPTPKRRRTQIAGGGFGAYPQTVAPRAMPDAMPQRQPAPPISILPEQPSPLGPKTQAWAGQQQQQAAFMQSTQELMAQQQALMQQWATQLAAPPQAKATEKARKEQRAGLMARLIERGVVDPAGRSHITDKRLFEWERTGTVMARGALASLIRASKELGRPIPGGGYRSLASQQSLQYKAQQGIPVAAPGKSLHEQGIAIDIPTTFLQANPKVIKILERMGWHRWNPSVEPWHFSYKKTG